MIKYASLFSGIGGFELGIQAASNSTGIKTKCVFASEFDPESKAKGINKQPARIIYNKNFGEYPHGDITKINASDVPDCDLIVAGVPCQSWSIAGKRCGFEDIRGTMWYEVFRILKEKKPKIALLENVKGILSHDGGKSFELICKELNKLGYIVNVEIYNTKHFGIPQNRERVFLTCTHIHEIVNIGHQTKMTISETTIQEYLFQIWLNNSNAVAKQQDRESKDLVLGWLLLCELIRALGQKTRFGFSLKTKRYLSKNYPNLFQVEDILQSTLNSNDWVSSEKRSKAIILTAMDEKSYTSATESVWQSIDILLQKVWEENYLGKSKYTTSTAIKQITDWKTFTYFQLVLSISTLIGRLRSSSNRSWNEILSGLIVIQEGTNYARINAIDEERVISESGNHYDGKIIGMEKANSFLVGHLTGSERSRSKIFPIGESPYRTDERTEQTTVNTLTAGGHSGGHHSSMTLICDSAHGFGMKKTEDQNTVPTLRANNGAASNNVIIHSTFPRSSKSGKGGTGHLQRNDGCTYCTDPNNHMAVEIQMGNYLNLATSYKVYDKKKKTNTVEILRILRKTIGKDSTEERRFAKFITFLETEILQSEVHGGGIPIQMERKPTRTTGELQSTAADYCNRMFEMWKQEKSRYTSYRQKQIEQLIREFTSSMQELPQPYSSQKGKVQDMWETREGVGVLRETLSTVQKMGESADGETQPIHRTTGIRRLTPVEVERLMGFPDNFTAGVADTNRYKCIGNSVTVPVVADIAEKILRAMV